MGTATRTVFRTWLCPPAGVRPAAMTLAESQPAVDALASMCAGERDAVAILRPGENEADNRLLVRLSPNPVVHAPPRADLLRGGGRLSEGFGVAFLACRTSERGFGVSRWSSVVLPEGSGRSRR